MPGHKGKNFLGFEKYDITEINGADSLFEAEGIILESEMNASKVFGHPTFYSCEGSSLCIRAMLYLACTVGKSNENEKPLILAGRNVHKTFLSAAALIDFDCEWLYPDEGESYLSCKIDATKLESRLNSMKRKPDAVYITSPDYLGNVCNIGELSKVCKKHGVLLLVDNAHGAYLSFLKPSQHPLDLGADMCCDSAHKTLPVVTGGAYLHINGNMPSVYAERAKSALSLFASTSPSYLILQSLDAANPYLSNSFPKKLYELIFELEKTKEKLLDNGYTLIGNEKTKLTIYTKAFGYYGYEFADLLARYGFICEFYDSDYVVMMFTPEIHFDDIKTLERLLLSIEKRAEIIEKPPAFSRPEKILSVRQAAFADCETVKACESEGMVLALCSVSCPPAVPIIVPGEKIDKNTVKCFKYYRIHSCVAVRKII